MVYQSSEARGCYSPTCFGMMHYEGRGAPKDYAMAHMFWNILAAQGNKNAAEMSGITKLMTPAQIEEAQ